MFWFGLLAGLAAGAVALMAQAGLYRDIRIEIKRLEREIEADRLQIAREERMAEALRVIARNTEEAARNR
ncbi:MAG TPA: hypothetical protein VLM89_16160 [Phycisphaerae bacterium]|nr:hypothetical protein [Phycisphaerae bacterium]